MAFLSPFVEKISNVMPGAEILAQKSTTTRLLLMRKMAKRLQSCVLGEGGKITVLMPYRNLVVNGDRGNETVHRGANGQSLSPSHAIEVSGLQIEVEGYGVPKAWKRKH